MIGLPFITELFKNILSASRGIQGRFYYCPKLGQEINTDDFDQLLKDEFQRLGQKKYPVDIMMPPVSQGYFIDAVGEWERYQFIHFFLTTTFYDGDNQVKDMNASTRTSTHSVLQDQHDMGRCARNFINVLDGISRTRGLIRTSFRLDSQSERIIRPVAYIGGDRLTGVRLDFHGSVFNGCILEDYTQENIYEIIVPDDDSHPEHQL